MTSIQQQAAELLEEFYGFSDEYPETDIAYRMAELLIQVRKIGGNVVYTQQAIDSARLAAFEAGRRKGLEDAASACDKISSHSVTVGYRNGALDSAALIRFLINKES